MELLSRLSRPVRIAIFLMLAVTLYRLWFITKLELVPDEAYYWLWSKHLAASYRDKGPAVAYRLVHSTLRKMPDVWIDPLEIRVVGLNDSLTEAVLAAIKPKVPASPYAAWNPKPYPGMTRFGETTLGGVSMDGAYIYPPSQSGASA